MCKLRPDEYPASYKLTPRRPLVCSLLEENEHDQSDDGDGLEEPLTRNIGVNARSKKHVNWKFWSLLQAMIRGSFLYRIPLF